MVIGFLAYIFIIDFPDKVLTSNHPFLTKAEVEIIKFRIDRDRNDSEADPMTLSKVLKHLSDWKLWCYALMFMSSTTPSYAFAYFLPVILNSGMHYSTLMSQLLSVPPYVFAVSFAFAMAWYSDKTRMRGPFIAFQAIVTIVGLALTGYAVNNNGVRYFGVFLGIAGSTANIPACLAYQSNNIRTNSKRSVGSALQIGFGSIGGIIASTVFRQKDAPRYIPGIWVSIGCQFLMLAIIAVTTSFFKRENRKQREEGKHLEGCEGFQYTI